jgi:hypothetical protein
MLSLNTTMMTCHVPPNIKDRRNKVQSSMAISTTQAVPLQVGSVLRRVISPIKIPRGLPTEVSNDAGQKSGLMRTIGGDFAGLIVIIFGFLWSRFPSSI